MCRRVFTVAPLGTGEVRPATTIGAIESGAFASSDAPNPDTISMPAVALGPREGGETPTTERWRLATPWSLSAGMHAMLLAALAGWILPLPWKPVKTELVASTQEPLENTVDRLPLASIEAAIFETDRATDPRPSPLATDATAHPAPPQPALVRLDPAGSSVADKRAAFGALDGFSGRKLGQEIDVKTVAAPLDPGTAVRSAAGAAAAIDAVLGEIRRQADEGDLLVVWLFDASLSLVDDREQIARRLKPFYNEELKQRENSHQVQSAAVAYGATVVELVKPTQHGGHVAAAVRKVPIDVTGLENVMTAVQHCVVKYRRLNKKWHGELRIIIWTDESGNDLALLEETIALCRSEGVVVSVVGPSAVLGAARGLHHYTDPGTGNTFLLPVDRGPDSPLPERLLLPFWSDDVAPWQLAGALAGQDAKWYGGPTASRFGPKRWRTIGLSTTRSMPISTCWNIIRCRVPS
ncbi:MAG: hypothetical protein B7Z73_12350 [Planctomycetia bacterium 21-64-5]|nr:MAG: hypothetical protein B7Z73_12350 [Planctomycetia bacterium 21-64-5]